MTAYYDVTLGEYIPHGSDILNRSCSVTFTYPGGSKSDPYSGTVLSWPQQNMIRMSSAYMNIDDAAKGMNGGTLAISSGGGPLTYPITGFVKLPGEDLALVEAAPMAASPVTPIFGVVFELNGTPVPISSESIAGFQQNGFSFTLPEPVDIGTPSDFLAWVDSTFGTTLKTTLDPNSLPGPLEDLVQKLLNVDVAVQQASVEVPPKGSTDSVTFTIALSGTFPGQGIQLIPGSNILTLKGGVAGATNQATTGGGT